MKADFETDLVFLIVTAHRSLFIFLRNLIVEDIPNGSENHLLHANGFLGSLEIACLAWPISQDSTYLWKHNRRQLFKMVR